jgi:Holliday junction resolvase RusA-like endonuclease
MTATLESIAKLLSNPDYVINIKMPLHSKARPRMTKSGHAYMAQSYRLAQAEMQNQILDQWNVEPLNGPIGLYVKLYGEGRGDGDNIVGFLMDAAGPSKNHAGILWQDDRVSVIPLVVVDWEKVPKADSRWLIHIIKL